MTLGEVPRWHERAVCRSGDVDPALFFPDRGEDQRQVKAICAACPVREECLEYALVNVERHGIWGGMSEKQRVGLRRKLRNGNRRTSPLNLFPSSSPAAQRQRAYRAKQSPDPEPVDKIVDVLRYMQKRFV